VRWILGGGCLLACAVAWLVFRPDRALLVATGVVSQTLCSGVFVSGLDPNQLFDEVLKPNPGILRLSKRLRYQIDPTRRLVATTWAGRFESVSIYRDGLGCLIVRDAEPLPATASRTSTRAAMTADSLEADPPASALEAALDHAFAEPGAPPYRWVKAIVILHNGKIVAERYARGYGVSTPMFGYSLAKSVTNALLGILVREGKLSVDQPAPVPEWRDPTDPRHAITLNQLLRMTAGLDLDENDSGFDPISRMLFLEPDMAGFAARAKLQTVPGTTWNYTSGNTLLLSRVIRDAVGGRAEDVLAFARRELFEPLGISTATIEFDSTGTPVGSQYVLMAARDWARFGMLYLNDGMAQGRRILPQGWVDYSTAPTLTSDYGAGFWTNRGSNEDAKWRVRAGMPPDSFYGSGNFGQRLVIAPAQGLVIVRLGFTHSADFDMKGLVRLVAEALVELDHKSLK
jgi:CubicO group peptidase (beta-lactamase class C family)